MQVLKRAVTGNIKRLRTDHSLVWKDLWSSGFFISHSKAESALNGNLINATLYHVLSQVRIGCHGGRGGGVRAECVKGLERVSVGEGW